MNTENVKDILNFDNVKNTLIKYPKLLHYYYDDIKKDRKFLNKILDEKPHHCFKIKNLQLNDLIYCIKKSIINNYNGSCLFDVNYLINNINFNNYSRYDRLLLLNTFKYNEYIYKSLIKRLNEYVKIEDLYSVYSIDIKYLEDLDIDIWFVLYFFNIKKAEDLLKLNRLYLEFDTYYIKKIINYKINLLDNITFYINENHYINNNERENEIYKIIKFIYENNFILKNISVEDLKILCEENDTFLFFLLEKGYYYEQFINYNNENYNSKLLDYIYLKNIDSINFFVSDSSKVMSYIDKYGLEVIKYLNKSILTEDILKKLIGLDKDKALKELLHKNIL